MISLFEKNMKRAKQELTDLKTAHERGLGTIEFFRSRIVFNASSAGFYRVTADIATGEPDHPILCPMVRTSDNKGSAFISSADSQTSSVRATIYTRKSTTVTVDLVCSSVLTNLAWEAL